MANLKKRVHLKLKHCSRCHKDKPLREFAFRRASPDGRQYHCRACDWHGRTGKTVGRSPMNIDVQEKIERGLHAAFERQDRTHGKVT